MSTESQQIRCPKLGHQVPLLYCYRQPEGRPCHRLFVCWEGIFPSLRSVVAKLITEEEWREYFGTPPASKVTTLVELIAQAQKNIGGRETGE